MFAGKISGVYNARPSPRCVPGRPGAASRRRTTGPAGTGSRCTTHGNSPVLKVGSTGGYVRRVQRALNAANPANKLRVSGVYDGRTSIAMRAYQTKLRLPASGVTNWAHLGASSRPAGTEPT